QSLIGVVLDGDIVTVREFLKDEANVNVKLQISNSPITFITPLDIAIEENKEIADLLRQHGGKTSEELKAEGK
ncbi:MAG: hypothetical protein ACPGR8_17640, partial [Limisphaerales bacterium]